MATGPILDLATLLAPIPGPDPAGRDVGQDFTPNSLFETIKDARFTAIEVESANANRPGGAGENAPTADKEWRKIASQATKLLQEQSKNFHVALLLTEALLRLHGFAGLRDGIGLAAGLLQTFPDGVYPRPDEDEGVGWTVATFGGIAAGLIQPIRAVEVSDCTEPGPVAYGQYLMAVDQRRGPPQANELTREDIEQSIRRSSPGFLNDLRDDLRDAAAALVTLQEAMDARVGRAAPSCGTVRRELEAIREMVVNLIGESAPAFDEEPAPDAAAEEAGAVKPAAPPPAAAGAINNRDDAFRQLLKIAEYFRKTEPHSPVAMAIEEAVRRGRLSLTDLVAELIPNEEARRMFYLSAGIKPQ
jgi:type VI secretion system protein ImpA